MLVRPSVFGDLPVESNRVRCVPVRKELVRGFPIDVSYSPALPTSLALKAREAFTRAAVVTSTHCGQSDFTALFGCTEQNVQRVVPLLALCNWK